MSQGNNSDGLPSKFLKAYLPGESGDDLELPISFNSCLPNSYPDYVTVRSIYGNSWRMALRKCGGDVEKYLLVDGWKRIVKDEDLKGGDFLAFEFDGSQCFNFCIYEHETMCKRLKRSSVPSKEITVAFDGEEETRASDDVIAFDDDDDDDFDDDDYNYAAVEDEDDDGDDGDDDDEDDDDDVEVEDDDDDERQYLDDRNNPYFTAKLNPKRKSQLHIPAHVIRDYDLNFPDRITILDKLGVLEKKIKIQANGCIFVKGFGSIVRRNKMKITDKMIYELKRTGTNLVHTMKVYIISG